MDSWIKNPVHWVSRRGTVERLGTPFSPATAFPGRMDWKELNVLSVLLVCCQPHATVAHSSPGRGLDFHSGQCRSGEWKCISVRLLDYEQWITARRRANTA